MAFAVGSSDSKPKAHEQQIARTSSEPELGIQYDSIVKFDVLADAFRMSIKAAKYARAAAYMHNNRVYVCIDQPLNIDRAHIQMPLQKWFQAINILQYENATIIEFLAHDIKNHDPEITMFHNANSWTIDVRPKNAQSLFRKDETNIIVDYNSDTAPQIELDMQDAAIPIVVRDHATGHKLFVFPSSKERTQCSNEYNFVDLNILRSFQGVAIEELDSNMRITYDKNKIRISNKYENHISPKVPLNKVNHTDDIDLTLPYIVSHVALNMLAFTAKDDFYQKLQDFWHRSFLFETTPYSCAFYSNIGMLYISNGLYKEGSALVDYTRKICPESKNDFVLSMIKAVSDYMRGEYALAEAAMNTIEVVNVPIDFRQEFRLWDGIIKYKNGDRDSILTGYEIDELLQNQDNNFMKFYIDEVKYEIAFALMEEHIKTKNIQQAEAVLHFLTKKSDILSAKHKNMLEYYAGLLSSFDGKVNTAKGHFVKCISDIDDLMNSAKCRYALDEMLYKNNELSIDEYIKELESLRIIWRGDDIERDASNLLGDLYMAKSDIRNALRAWNVVRQYYGESEDNIHAIQKMSDTFVDFFLQPAFNDPFFAASLFYEFRDLIPIGESGDKIAMNFADILESMDLVHSAGIVLKHLIDNRLSGINQELAINDIMRVYITDGRYYDAMLVLTQGDKYEELPEVIASERKRLHAEALVNLGQKDNALLLLNNDLSEQADMIRCAMFWDNKDYDNFSKYSEPYLYQIAQYDQELSDIEVYKVAKQAIAYAMLEKYDLLEKLYKTFYKRIPSNNKYKISLALIANLLQITGPMDGDFDMNVLYDIVHKLSQQSVSSNTIPQL